MSLCLSSGLTRLALLIVKDKYGRNIGTKKEILEVNENLSVVSGIHLEGLSFIEANKKTYYTTFARTWIFHSCSH
jgi:hypothetical protein